MRQLHRLFALPLFLTTLLHCRQEPSIPAAPPAASQNDRSDLRPRLEVPPDHLEQLEIEAAMRANDCRQVDDVVLMFHVDDRQRRFVETCWEKRQRELIVPAIASGKCESVLRLPGMYPKGTAEEQRFVYHCWMKAGQMDLDSCIGMMHVGDESSIPFIVSVLKRNEPVRTDKGDFAVIDTAGACMAAFERITHSKARDAAAGWSTAWREWASSQLK